VIQDEWPAMARGEASPEGWDDYGRLWAAMLGVEPHSDKQTALWQTTIEQMDALSMSRRKRVLFANRDIPSSCGASWWCSASSRSP
jgi:hypothetical protein